MNDQAIRILFSEHGVVNDNTKVANLQIYLLLDIAKENRISVIRTGNAGECDRAVFHPSNEKPLKDFLSSLQSSLFALRVTTTRPGVPLHEHHILLENPTRIGLSVRRMDALKESEVWTSFLRATEQDLIAIYEGRLSDVQDNVKAMLRLFVEHEEALPALKILCMAFEEVQKRAIYGGDFWIAKSLETRKADWWLKALNEVVISGKDAQNNEVKMRWKKFRDDQPYDATKLFLTRLHLEALHPQPENTIIFLPKLIEAIHSVKNIDEDIVCGASSEITKMYG